MNKIKIALADDHPVYLDGLKTVLVDNPEFEIVGEATNGKEIIEVVKNNNPDVVLLDIRMPVMDGVESAKKIKDYNEDINIIMVTQYDEKSLINECQKMGIEGYILKDSDRHDLIEAVKNVYCGGVYYNIKDDRRKNNISDNLSRIGISISKREMQVLELMAEDKNCNEISKNLCISKSSVKTYSARLREKLGANTISGMMAWAYKYDYI